MKKVLFLGLVFGAVAFTSCKKTYTCEVNGATVEYSEEDYTSAQIDAAETACNLAGGEWSSK